MASIRRRLAWLFASEYDKAGRATAIPEEIGYAARHVLQQIMPSQAVAPVRHLAKGPGLRRSSPRVQPVPVVYKAAVTTQDGAIYRVWLGKASSKEHALHALSVRFPGAAVQVYAA